MTFAAVSHVAACFRRRLAGSCSPCSASRIRNRTGLQFEAIDALPAGGFAMATAAAIEWLRRLPSRACMWTSPEAAQGIHVAPGCGYHRAPPSYRRCFWCWRRPPSVSGARRWALVSTIVSMLLITDDSPSLEGHRHATRVPLKHWLDCSRPSLDVTTRTPPIGLLRWYSCWASPRYSSGSASSSSASRPPTPSSSVHQWYAHTDVRAVTRAVGPPSPHLPTVGAFCLLPFVPGRATSVHRLAEPPDYSSREAARRERQQRVTGA